MTLDAQRLRDDELARATALDVGRSCIVQAPAGSGKTQLLIQRYLKLLAIVDHPEEVLAITFTRKAAAEMQLRVLEALQSAQDGEPPPEPHHRTTFQAAAAALHRDQELDWNLIANPRRLRIQTLDSLNASIARTLPLTSTGGAAGNSVSADAEMQANYRHAATLTLDQLPETGPMHEATAQVLLHVDNNTSLYVSYVARMLATRDQWLPFVGSGLLDRNEQRQLRDRFETNLENAVLGHLDRLRASIPIDALSKIFVLGAYAADQLLQAGTADNPLCALRGQLTAPDSSAESVPQWLGLAELLLSKQGQVRKTVTKAQGFPVRDDGQKQTMLDLLQSLAEQRGFLQHLQNVRALPPVRYDDEQWAVLLALFRLLPLAVTELKRLFSERGVSDFIEIALTASEALGSADEPGDVALLLDYQLRHLLVDEMQDTSSAQYRMLGALTGGWQEGDGRTLFCVGDPMQSIYRFRNAEVGQFLLARVAGIGAVHLQSLTLRRNFRSGQNLVDWFNEVFPTVLPEKDDSSQSAVAYSAAVSVEKLAGQGQCIVHPLFGSDAATEADAGCAIVHKTLDEHPHDDMAVLVRSRSHLPRLLARFREAGIAYRAVEIDRLTDLPEIIDILALTRALVHHGDRLAWLAVLRSPWVGLDWRDLHALVIGRNHATVWELLHDTEQLDGLSRFGRDAISSLSANLRATAAGSRSDSLRDRIERAWLALGGPAILDDANAVENVYRYLDVIESLETAGSLADVAELEDALDLEHVSSNANARLQVMTMHRAKGLQFDHVLLHGLGRATGRHERAVLSWFDVPKTHGDDEKIVSPVGPRVEIENDPLHRFIELTESVKFRHELGRLLYVACTRARKSLHLLGHVELSADGSAYRAARKQSLLSLLWPSVVEVFDQAFDASAVHSTGNDDAVWLMPQLRRFESPWQLPEVRALPGETSISESADEGRTVEFYWVGTEARIAGTLVHRWLQLATDKRIDLASDTLQSLRPTTQRWLAEMGIGDAATATVIERVEAALAATLDDPKGQWLLDGNGHAELPLSGLYQGRVESVLLDRVRIDDDGTHWIVDYKTSTHEGGNLQNFLAAEIDRYTPQLSKYAALYEQYSGVSVRCALYFPLLQEFVEVKL